MSGKRVSSLLVAAVGLLLAITHAGAWHENLSGISATIDAPAEVRLDKADTFTMVATVTAPDGSPFEGEVQLWSGYAWFEGTEGTPLTVPVKNGRAEAVVSVEHITSAPRGPIQLGVTLGDEVLASVEVPLRNDETIELLEPDASVVADGAARPGLRVVVRDQFGVVLEDAEVTARFNGPQGRHLQASAQTGTDGAAQVLLPPSDKEGYAVGQFVTERCASVPFTVLYAAERVATAPLRSVEDQLPAPLRWDDATRTATVKVGDFSLSLQEGATVARLNGSAVPLGAPAVVRDGRMQVSVVFLREALGLKVPEGLSITR